MIGTQSEDESIQTLFNKVNNLLDNVDENATTSSTTTTTKKGITHIDKGKRNVILIIF